MIAESAIIGPSMPSPIGHALAGVAAAWIADLVPGRRRWRVAPPSASWYTRAGDGFTLVCVVLAMSPDLDILYGPHRTVTHSIGAVMFIALFSAAIAVDAQRPVARVTLMCASAYASHLLLDWLGVDDYAPQGIKALWPFSNAWYISGLNVFPQTARKFLTEESVIRQNAKAIATEIVILLPIVLALWRVRVKALAGLPPEVPGGNHPAK